MDSTNELRRLAGLSPLIEKKEMTSVNTSSRPPEGLFASGAKADIIAWLKDNHKEYASAMSALNFFINRAGKNLTADRKGVLESCKDALRKAYGVKEALEPFDLQLLRHMAGLPVVENDEEEAEAEEVDSATEKESDFAVGEEELPAIINKIASAAEGKTGDEMVAVIKDVYDAGFNDGVASLADEAPAAEESEAVEESHQLTSSIGVDKEDDAGWMAVELAKAGMTVDMEEAMGVFFFNFKNPADEAKAKALAAKLEIALTEATAQKIEQSVNALGEKTGKYRAEKSPGSLKAIQNAEEKLIWNLSKKQ